MTREGTKALLLDRISRSREALESTIRGLDEGRLLAVGPEGWSVRDHLAHLTAWRRKVLAVINNEPPWQGLGVSEEEYNSADVDRLNAEIHERDRQQPLAQVLAEFRGVHRSLVEAVKELTEDDLNRPYSMMYGDPDKPDQRRLEEGIAANTWEHDDEHNVWIRALLKR